MLVSIRGESGQLYGDEILVGGKSGSHLRIISLPSPKRAQCAFFRIDLCPIQSLLKLGDLEMYNLVIRVSDVDTLGEL